MTRIVGAVIFAISTTVAAVAVSPAVAAEPLDAPPCDLAMSFLCGLVPMAPDLEGDVDLTKQQPGPDSGLLTPESAIPVDPCINGCI